MPRPHIAAVMTVHNRREMTLACLASLDEQRPLEADITPVVFDDGSTDGTAEAIAERFPGAVLLRGDGSFFWNGGMRVAMAAARRMDPDHILWLNDDTTLASNAVDALLGTLGAVGGSPTSPIAVCGAVLDPDDGTVAYSGVQLPRFTPMRFEKHDVVAEPTAMDTMNGNCVLLTRAAVALAGNLDPTYTHGMGDYDYGLTLRARGGEVWLAPGVLGHCHANPGFVPVGDSIRKDLARLRSTKYLPPTEWGHFVRAWGGPAWPLWWASPYVRATLELSLRRLRTRSG